MFNLSVGHTGVRRNVSKSILKKCKKYDFSCLSKALAMAKPEPVTLTALKPCSFDCKIHRGWAPSFSAQVFLHHIFTQVKAVTKTLSLLSPKGNEIRALILSGRLPALSPSLHCVNMHEDLRGINSGGVRIATAFSISTEKGFNGLIMNCITSPTANYKFLTCEGRGELTLWQSLCS